MSAADTNASPAPAGPVLRYPFLLLLLVLITIGGAALTIWNLRLANRRFRADLLQQTTLIAWALRADHVAALTGSEADRASALYNRIHDQLICTRAACPDGQTIRILRRGNDGSLVGLVSSERADAPGNVPAGQPWFTTAAVLRVLDSGRSQTEGPYPGGGGNCIRAIVPLFHPVTDQVVAVLCLDADAGPWRRMLARQAILPAGSSLLLLLILGVGRARIHRRPPLAVPQAGHAFWRVETRMAAALALVVTATATLLAHDGDRWARHESFRRLATVHASLLQQSMFRIGDNYLEGIGRLFMSSNFVDQREFHEYVDYLLSRPYAQAWGWIPVVAAADRTAFEQELRRWAVPDFTIWEYDAAGSRVPAAARDRHFPICYAEPQECNAGTLGYDLAAQPAGRQAIEEALRTRLTTATVPMSFIKDGTPPNYIIVLRPVFASNDETKLSGFALVVLRLELLLRRAISRESTRNEDAANVRLFDVQPDGHSRFLASSVSNPPPLDDPMRQLRHLHQEFDSLLAPVFAFGRVYMMAALPGSDFARMHPLRSGRWTAATGLTLSALVVALVGILTSRRSALERLVAERTADLRASESSYHGLFNSIRQAIYIMDKEGRFIDVNEGALAMYGYAREDFVGNTPAFLSAPEGNDLDAVGRAHHAAWNGTPQYFEFRGRRKNGEVFPKDVWLCKGSYFGQDVVIAMASDVSERKRAEQDRNRLQDQLQQSQKMESIGRLAGGVAHDFNNMLQAILGNAALALQAAPPAPVGDYLSEIRRSAERSADLTRQLLAFASRQTVTPRVLDLNDTISGMLKMLGRLIGEDIRLQWVPGSGVWPIKMDPSQLDQILANLAVNARDAIGGVGTLTIETANLTCREDDCEHGYRGCSPGDYATLTVRDTGTGMDEHTRAHLFEPFFTTKKPGQGVGLGLATVFGIVKQNRGFISVQSVPGHGSTFLIGIPRASVERAAPASVEVRSAPPPLRGGSETVLLVEDEKAILRIGEESLRRLGYRILAAQTPQQAVDLARQHAAPIHLMITDVVLPEMNGRELALLMSSLHPEMRCLFMSGYTADVIAERGVLDEHVHFLQKPFTLEALAASVRKVLDGDAHA